MELINDVITKQKNIVTMQKVVGGKATCIVYLNYENLFLKW
jgi:hypothetical protein